MKIRLRLSIPLLILLLALAAGIVVYGVFKWAVNEKPDREIKVIVSVKATEQIVDFWKVLIDGVNDAANEFGATAKVIGPPREVMIDEQIAQLERAIEEKPDVIVLAATDYNRLVPTAQKIVKAGIKLITVDSSISSDDALSHIATDNIAAGAKAGEELANLLPEGAKVAVMSHSKGTSTQMEREQGAVRRMKELGLDVVGIYYTDGIENKAREITLSLLMSNPNIEGIVGLNEMSTVGVGKAIRELGSAGKVKLVGFDSSLDEVKLLEEGILQGTIVQKPYNMGYLSVKSAVKAINGERIPKVINTELVVINKQNMYTEQNQKLLFPFVGK
ncbi:substrate-binding domain-containing protein [Paenibacillus sp. NPDC058071]|uniref:substrate-binding domain-containing protein n=1 Tax=Paenibacillus sp. NPDC058071 TaxID=3346326 RepID=UPI0036DD5E33